MRSTSLPARRRASGLLLKIAGALAAVGTVPLVLAVSQLADVNREALVEQLLRTHTVAARTAADQINAFLGQHRSLARALASDSRLADPTGPAGQVALADSLVAWSDAGVVGIVIHDPDGGLAVRVQRREAAATVEALLADAPDPTPTLGERDGRLWAVVSAALPGERGTLALVVDAEPVVRALAPDELGDQATVLLLDRSGHMLATGGARNVGALPTALLEGARTGRLSGAGRFPLAAGPEVVGSWSSADEGRWLVVSTQPAEVAEAAARRMARRSALALGLALGLTGLISLAAWRGLVQPLRALLAAQRQVAGLTRTPARGSETAELKAALSAMERHVQDRHALDAVFLGRYQVLEIIASGGMGTVFRGWDPRLQRAVALKTIHVGRRADSTGRALSSSHILGEAMRAAQITHPNVVAVYDAEETGEVAYVAMELVEGVGLDHYLEERGRLDWREAMPLAREVAHGLAAAHARDLIHRDIKPGNVLLGHDGSVKISDFGLSTYVHLRAEEPGKVFGTPGFLAPEVLAGEPYDARADLYALGVVLFRAILGSYPFRGTEFREIVRSTVRDPSPTVVQLVDQMPEPAAEIVAGLLRKRPEERLGPADELAVRLDSMCRELGLGWRLDFAREAGLVDARNVFASTSLPSLQIDRADL